MRRFSNTFDCPVCGEEVPVQAKSCPECGACDKSGWSGERYSEGLGLPSGDFDYEGFVREEFQGGSKSSLRQWLWRLVALAVLIGLVWVSLAR